MISAPWLYRCVVFNSISHHFQELFIILQVVSEELLVEHSVRPQIIFLFCQVTSQWLQTSSSTENYFHDWTGRDAEKTEPEGFLEVS